MLNHCRTDGSSVLGDVTEHFIKKNSVCPKSDVFKSNLTLSREKKKERKENQCARNIWSF